MKSLLKNRILAKRVSMKKITAIKKGGIILKNLSSLPEFKSSKNIMFYVSFNNEADTCSLINKFSDKKNIIVPITNKKNKTLMLSKLKCFDDLQKGCYGILEPKKSAFKRFNKKNLDLVIVPGVAFDAQGNRIGYGHGYYDIFLKGLKKNIPLIGLAYDFQIVKKIPHQKHDVPVHIIITEKRILRVKQ